MSSSHAESSQRAADDAKIQHIIASIDTINKELESADPFQILTWAIDNLPGLYQTTAFGVTGCVSLDQISKISRARALSTGQPNKHLVPLIFIDTLYHFPQTLDLAQRAASHYGAPMHTYTPPGTANVGDFERKWGPQLWERDEDTYDYLVKVEPARRAYEELGVRAVFTGRRRSQGSDRASLTAVEVDETGLVKVNPFLNWSFAQVDEYVKQNAVPYNELLDMGYKSIGDWHSTSLPTADGATGERSGRWKDKAGSKTECGLHSDYFRLKKLVEKKIDLQARKEQQQGSDESSKVAAASDVPVTALEPVQPVS